jgi:hypothetical protein
MADGNNPAPAGTADNTPAPTSQADVERQVGDALLASLDEEQPEQAEAQTADGETDSESTADAAATEETEEEKPEEVKPEEPDDDVVVRVDGDTKVPLSELKKGYLRQSDYTRKTQEISETRKQIQAERETLNRAGQELASYLDVATTVLKESIPQPPDPALINTDAIGYLQQKEAYDRGMQRLQAATAARQNIGQQSQQMSQGEMAEIRQRELTLLQERIPELQKQEAKEKLFSEIVEVGGKAYGIKPEEVAQILDHRHIMVLRDAISWRKLQKEKMEAVRKAKSAPPIKPSARVEPGTRDAKQQAAAIDRLKSEGSREALMGALTNKDLGL